MRPHILILIALVGIGATQNPTTAQAQPPAWVHFTKDDPLHGLSLDVFTLEGKYLSPPSKTDGTPPRMVLRCSGGKLKDGYVFVGAVVDRGADGAPVELRLDGKFSKEFWTVGTDGKAVFMNPTLDPLKILYGTWLPHKEGKGDFIHQEIIGVPEAYGSTIVMQFDMPQDQTAMLDACTHIVNHRRFAR